MTKESVNTQTIKGSFNIELNQDEVKLVEKVSKQVVDIFANADISPRMSVFVLSLLLKAYTETNPELLEVKQ